MLKDEAVAQYDSSVTNRGKDAVLYSVYGQMATENTSLLLQALAADVNDASVNSAGTANGDDARPLALNVTPSLMLTETLEGVFSFSYIDSDGIGVNPSEVTRRANLATNNYWDKYKEFYIGLNYYIQGDDIKLMVGYLNANGEDTLGVRGGRAIPNDQDIEIQGFRARLQVLF